MFVEYLDSTYEHRKLSKSKQVLLVELEVDSHKLSVSILTIRIVEPQYTSKRKRSHSRRVLLQHLDVPDAVKYYFYVVKDGFISVVVVILSKLTLVSLLGNNIPMLKLDSEDS